MQNTYFDKFWIKIHNGAELSSRNYGGSSERENMQECRGAVITHDKAHKNERGDEAMNSKVGENFAREP